MLMSISSVSGGGKTFSALLVAAGLAGPNGRVGFIDTENGRGSMYADSPSIVKAYPNGYDIAQLDPPFAPANYISAITAAEKAGMTVLVIDSTTHEWEGIGGCTDIAASNKIGANDNWGMAKREHKKFVNHCLSSPMHIIFCIRARDKVKVVDVVKQGRKTIEYVSIGIQPITEKNFVFEMLVSLQLEEITHHATPIKVPEPLAHLCIAGKLLTKEDGEKIRLWNDGGRAVDPNEQLLKRANTAAEDGMEAYERFFKALTLEQRKAIPHAKLKSTAEAADRDRPPAEPDHLDPLAAPEVESLPDPGDYAAGDAVRFKGAPYVLRQDGVDLWWEKMA